MMRQAGLQRNRTALSCAGRTLLALLWRFRLQEWNDHGDPPAILSVLIGIKFDHVPFLKEDTNKDVAACRHCEQQMSRSHRGGRPESDEEAQVDRVSDHLIKARRAEGEMVIVLA